MSTHASAPKGTRKQVMQARDGQEVVEIASLRADEAAEGGKGKVWAEKREHVEEGDKRDKGQVEGWDEPPFIRALLVFFGHQLSLRHPGYVWVPRFFLVLYLCVGPVAYYTAGSMRGFFPSSDILFAVFVVAGTLTFLLGLIQHRALFRFHRENLTGRLRKLLPVPEAKWQTMLQWQHKWFLIMMVVYVGVFLAQLFPSLEIGASVLDDPEWAWLGVCVIVLEVTWVFWPVNVLYAVVMFLMSCQHMEMGLRHMARTLADREVASDPAEVHEQIERIANAVRMHTEFWQLPWTVTQLGFTNALLSGMLLGSQQAGTDQLLTLLLMPLVVLPLISVLLYVPARLNFLLQRLSTVQMVPSRQENRADLVDTMAVLTLARPELRWTVFGMEITYGFLARVVYVVASVVIVSLSQGSGVVGLAATTK